MATCGARSTFPGRCEYLIRLLVQRTGMYSFVARYLLDSNESLRYQDILATAPAVNLVGLWYKTSSEWMRALTLTAFSQNRCTLGERWVIHPSLVPIFLTHVFAVPEVDILIPIFSFVTLHPLLVMADSPDSDSDFGDIGYVFNPWSGSLNDCSVKGLHKVHPPQGCTFLNDDDATLLYSHGWILNSSNPNLPRYTVHSALNAGPSVSMAFNR